MSKRYGTVEERFWRNVQKGSGCWEWTGGTRQGYGRFRIGRKKITAHRYAYLAYHGALSGVVRHKCDNRLCVNPDHLEVGTLADNVADMDARGRRSVGEGMPHAKLVQADIIRIRADSRPHRAIAKDYGVSHCVIGRIKRGEDWRHVESMTQT
jgi:hypothetical protein